MHFVLEFTSVPIPSVEDPVVIWDAGTPGQRIRYKLDKAIDQLSSYSKDKCPTILVLSDQRPPHVAGIDPYEILVGMYGTQTIQLFVPQEANRPPRFGPRLFGKGNKLRPNHNDFISGIGVLRERVDGLLHVDIYVNAFASKTAQLPIDWLVRRADFSVFELESGHAAEFRTWIRVTSSSSSSDSWTKEESTRYE